MCAFLRIVLLLAATAQPVTAETPLWSRPDSPCRVVFRLPQRSGRTALLTVPAQGKTLDPAGFVAISHKEEQVPVEVLRIGATEAQVLVQTESLRTRTENALYYGGSERNGGSTRVQDPYPFLVDRHRLPGGSMPNSWEKALHLLRRSGRAVDYSYESGLGELAGFRPGGHGRHGSRKHRDSIAVVHTMLRCAEAGVYTFGVQVRGVGFLAVNGELVASQLDPHASRAWHEGASLRLEKGVHRVEIWAFQRRNTYILPQWLPPGAKRPGPIPATSFCTATEIKDQRAESIDRTLHAGFTYEILTPYRFEGNPAFFVPVRFRDISRNWLARNTGYRWHFGDGVEVNEQNPLHVFVGAGFHKASLTVRDSLGFEAESERGIDCRLAQPEEYAVAAEVVRLPPVCYPSDAVEPALRISGDVPERRALDVAWTVHGTDKAGTHHRQVFLAERHVDVPLCRETTRRLRRIAWTLSHHDILIGKSEIVFSRPPFDLRPAEVRGSHLFDARGRLVVLVPYEHGGQRVQPPISTREAFGRVACVDDSLASSGLPGIDELPGFDRILARIVNGPDRPIVRCVTLPDWSEYPQAHGRLVKLVEVPAALAESTDVAILSLGLRDMLAAGNVQQFEREAAALTDLLSATMGTPVVWVTMPPYPPDPSSTRPYAAAVQKIAAARRIPVADLFTAFLASRPNFREFFHGDDLRLSEQGRQMAARVIARALLSTAGEREDPRL